MHISAGLIRHLAARVAVICAFTALTIAASLASTTEASAGTPLQPKSCGYSGGPSCPPEPIIEGNWYYQSYSYQPNPTQYFNSIPELDAWFISVYQVPAQWADWCNVTDAGVAQAGGNILSYDGIQYYIPLQITYTYYFAIGSVGNYTCPGQPGQLSRINQIFQRRNVYCPTPTSVVYQASPLVGPYCSIPASTPNPLKQAGSCASCSSAANPRGADAGSGGTTKADADVSSGNQYHAEVDYQGTGNNPLQFVRSYNSMAAYLYNTGSINPVGSEGYVGAGGWSATYFQYLLPISVTDSTTTYNAVYAFRPDGREITFNAYNGAYSPDGDVADSLVKTSTGWQYQTADDTIETYNAQGQLLSVQARGRAAVTVNYATGAASPGDPPSSVSDAFGHTLTFTYQSLANATNSLRRLASIADPNGQVISYTYDTSYGRITQVTYPDSTTRQYGYSTSYNRYLMVTLTDEASNAYASWTYNTYGQQVATSQLAGGVNEYQYTYSTSGSGGSVGVTDPLGKARTYNQSLVWGRYRTTSSSASCPGCADDASRTYDANGNISVRTDFNGNSTHYAYDLTTNRETSRTEAYGTANARTITTQWDSSWRQPDTITEPNRTTTRTYDSMGNMLTKMSTDTTVTPNVSREWTYTYDSYGRMLTAKGPRTDVNSTTTYTYYTCTTGSQCGQLETVTDPVGNVTTYNTYNPHGQPLTITDPNGVVTTLAYDLRMRLTSRQVGTETTSFSYYNTGLLKQVTLPDSSYVLYTYDNAHRLTKISDGAGNSIQYTLDNAGNRTVEKTYDPSSVLHRSHTRAFNTLNQLYQDINAANTSAVTTTYGYDSNGNQNSIAAPLSRNTANAYDQLNRLNQITDPNSGNTYFGYDSEDDLTSVKDPKGLTTSYTYNGFGDLATQVSPDTGTTTNTYDSGGNLATSTDARSAVSTYAYDAANRVTSIVYSNSGVSDQTITFGYDTGTNGKGRLTSASDANHSLSWTYDFAGRVTGKGLTVGGVNLSVGYGYTNADRTALVTPSGQSVTYSYNSNHQITSIKVNGATVLSSVTYEPFGGVNGWSWGDGATTSRTFNGDGLISQIVTAGVTLGYTFDNANRITGVSDSSNSALTWTYGYDLLDRLTSATTSAITDGWTYDANGNRLTQTGTTAIAFNVSSTSNQLTSTSGGLVRSYIYDAAGHTQSNGANGLGYNNRGRMVSSNGSTNYLYNALGQMIEKSGTPGTTLFMQDESGHLIGEYSSTGALVEETIWLGDIPVATLQPNGSGGVNIFYVHTDHLNTPRKVAQPSTGTLAWRWDSDPFGTAAPNQNPAGLGTFPYNLRFPGQYYQAETGLNQNVNRDYDPLTGKYIESDPIGLAGGSYSTYAYADGSPIGASDPFGLFTSDQHAAMTFEVLANDSDMLPCLREALAGAIGLDFVPGSQSIASAYMHSMAQPGQSAAAAAKQSNDYINSEIAKCDCTALGYALHTAQDSAAWGHQYKTYYGPASMWSVGGLMHLIADYWPSEDRRTEAIMKSKNVVAQYKAHCKNCSK